MVTIKGLNNKKDTLNLLFGDLKINADDVVITEFNLEGGEKEIINDFTSITTVYVLKLSFRIPPFKVNGDNNLEIIMEENKNGKEKQ